MNREKLHDITMSAIMGTALTAVGICGGACPYNAEMDANKAREKQYQGLPEAARQYDFNRDGKIDLIEAEELEKELLKHVEKEH